MALFLREARIQGPEAVNAVVSRGCGCFPGFSNGGVTKRSRESLILLGFGGIIPSLDCRGSVWRLMENGHDLRIARGMKFSGGRWEGCGT